MHRPTLYLMLGYPGAGKTTAAEIIQRLTGAEHISSDQVRLELFPQPNFTQTEHDQLYKALDKRTEALLRSGRNVVYDANLNRYQHRQDKYEICQRTNARPLLLWVQTPRDVAKSRSVHESRQRLWPKHETPEAMFERIVSVIEPPLENEPYISVDGTKINDTYIRQLIGQE